MPDGSVPDVHTRILNAAERIVQARGVPALTLDGAAREAGVSKGGLLYHFGTKEALLMALLQRLADQIERDFEALVAVQPEGQGRVVRACLAWGFDQQDMCQGHDRAAAVFLAAFHHDPVLLDPVRRVVARIRAETLSDGTPMGAALAVMTASDGLFMARVFRLYEPTPAELAALRAQLAGLLEGRA
jgi:AcrR family transcriptional regulator